MDHQRPGEGYAHAEAARALRTALDHPDAATRDRAEVRLDRWGAVLRGMLDGTLRVGTRTPVADLPAWVTPEVLRGGFATGRPAAELPLRDHELALAPSAGIPARRSALFAHHLGEAGLARLCTMLDDGRYRVRLPEQGALLAVAHLVRTGHLPAAVELVRTLAPFADRLALDPEPADVPLLDVRPAPGWEVLARRAFAGSAAHLERAHGHPWPESVARSAAEAWRQSLFFLSMADAAAQERFVDWAAAQRPGLPAWVLDGLADALGGAVLGRGRRFVGWITGPHPVLTGGPRRP
jgi:hypothetical protein